MKTVIHDLEYTRGDTFKARVTIKNVSRDDVTGLTFSAKHTTDDTDYVFQETIDTGGFTPVDETVTDADYVMRIAPERTQDVDTGEYVYDLEFRLGDDVYTLMAGKLTLADLDVTRRDG